MPDRENPAQPTNSAAPPIGISVVVPSYNQGRFIDDTIRSLLDQDYPALEILVMDGGSTDDTVDRLRQYGDAIQWVSERDEGQSHAIIKGFERCSHPWITWLNSDDVQSNRALWCVNDAVLADPDTDVVVGGAHYMAEDGTYLRAYPTIDFGPGRSVTQAIFDGGYMAQPSLFYKKSLYDRVGGLNKSLHLCMDYELWARFALAGAKFVRVDKDLSGNRWYENTKTAAQTLDLYAEILATQHRLFGAPSPYYVQALSDYLYAKFHARFFGDQGHLWFRWVYFKAIWAAMNARAPWRCIKGLVRHTIAKSGPLAADYMTFADWRSGLRSYVRTRRGR